jgi:hypothetical protein
MARMAPAQDQINALYKLPLEEFTAARNALAKSAGSEAETIRRLKKPTLAAWAVNQIYWHHRAVFDRLVKASSAVRQAHLARIGGKKADVASLEGAHRAAVDAALKAATSVLGSPGSGSAATLAAVEKTLLAVPSPEIAGRLVEPIESVGFGLLSGLIEAGSPRGLADVVSFGGRGAGAKSHSPADDRNKPAKKADPAAAAREAKAAAEARRRDRVRLTRSLKEAVAAEAAANAEFARAKKAITSADARIDRLERELAQARADADRRREDLERVRGEANDAAATRVQRERALNLLGE